MHRAYQPILPCGNKYLQQKWDKTYYDEHKKKVQSAKPMVDTNSPQTYVHLNLKLKKLKLEEERLSVIERDNHMLLEKMSTIMRTKGRIDNKNNYEGKSLNKEKREQELLKVSRENQNIEDRLTKCEPQYRVEKWHEDWVKAEKYMDSIAKYPRGWYAARQQKMLKGKKKTAERDSVVDNNAKEEKDDNDGGRESLEKKGSKKQEEMNKEKDVNNSENEVKEAENKREEKAKDTNQQKTDSKIEETQEKNKKGQESGRDAEKTKGSKALVDENEDDYYDTGKDDKSDKSEVSESDQETDREKDEHHSDHSSDTE
ncbi:uncharacterized protein CFAP97D2 [Mixophyes fleayi]|uniref:uncharacterized protein CFAP97D2 n=1 Tax=Mixophyes fleayi TaxID=3061075 RepID=UPI003F4D7F01